jgi:hypothetical protein
VTRVAALREDFAPDFFGETFFSAIPVTPLRPAVARWAPAIVTRNSAPTGRSGL